MILIEFLGVVGLITGVAAIAAIGRELVRRKGSRR